MPKIPVDTPNRISAEFQSRMIEILEEQECKKDVFARRVGISPPVISNAVIYGIIPSLRPLMKIADYLKVSLPYLLGETEVNDFYASDSHATFHTRIAELTKEKHTNYSQISNRMPFSKNFFYEWQNKKTLPSLDYLKALAEYFKVSIDYLLGRTDDRN